MPALLAIEVERRRLFLWLPACFALGILAYFAADREPALWAPIGAATLSAAGAFAARRHWVTQAALIALCALFAGFSSAAVRTLNTARPALHRVMVGQLSGFVESVEERKGGARILVAPTAFDKLAANDLPAHVRVTSRTRTDVKPGDFITANARLLPPPEPARPGGYDFARDAFFQGLGAVGSVSGAIRIAAPPHEPSFKLRMNAGIDRARNALTERIVNAFGGQAGAVAAALVTGKRGYISEATNDDLRGAGIYHVVSISGLHMVLAAGVFFWAARALLSLVPLIALKWPVKKLAALVGMAGATAYCLFSGSEVATERSLFMTLVMFGAILADRPALSMRNLAISALIVLGREPETLLGPSFQMSFAAVAGLIAFAETPRKRAEQDKRTWRLDWLLRAAWRALVADLLTTCVATLATAPFSVYHFQTLNPLGILGNAMTLPFISLIIMPAAVIGVVAAPFGLDGPIWWVMGLATQPVLMASHAISQIDRASVVVPAFGPFTLGLMVLAILFATLWTTALRWLAIAPALFGLVAAAQPDRSDILIDRGAQGVAVRGHDGRFVLLGRPSGFVVEQWLKADGDQRQAGNPSLKDGAACDKIGCVARLADGRAVSLVLKPEAFEEDCRRASVIVSRLRAPPDCMARLVIDADTLEAGGAVAVRARAGGFDVTSARDPHATRPWLRPVPPQVLTRLAERDAARAKAKHDVQSLTPANSPANSQADEAAPPVSDEAETFQ